VNWGLYLHQVRRWALLAILPAALVALVTYGYTVREAKQYDTTAILYVQQPSTGSSVPGSTDVITSQALIPTYTQMIGSPVITNQVDRVMKSSYPGYRLENHSLKVAAAGTLATQLNTQLLNITVTDIVPARAAVAANSVAHAFIRRIRAIQRSSYRGGEQAIQRQLDLAQSNIQDVSQRINGYHGPPSGLNNLRAQQSAYQSIYQSLLTSSQEFSVGRDTALNAVKVFSPALTPTSPIGPHPARSALLAAFVALLLCAGGIFLYDYFDDTPRTPEEVEEIVGAPILGTVQQFNPGKYGTQLITMKRHRSPVSEAYRVIRTNLQYTDIDKPPKVVVVTSASPGEGKSTTVSNLASVLAQAGRHVTLVDGDLRRPSLQRVFQSERQEGLTNVLAGDHALNGQGRFQTEQPNLVLIASGPVPPRPADLLGSERMRSFVSHLREDTDMILIDSPPLLAVTDAAVLSTVTDGVILVVDPAKSKRRDLHRAREAVEAVGGRTLGIVINRLNQHGSAYYYYYYNHNYGHQYAYDYSQQQDEHSAANGPKTATDVGEAAPAGREARS